MKKNLYFYIVINWQKKLVKLLNPLYLKMNGLILL